MKKPINYKSKKFIISCIFLGLILLILCFFGSYGLYILNLSRANPKELSAEDKEKLENIIKTQYSDPLIQKLPYEKSMWDISLHAKSAIVIDNASGWIVYEKNADLEIPPASMTKLVLMYAVMEEVESGKINLEDMVELPPEAWAKNAPPHSSLMFLGQGQKVTLDEILTGLNVVSGNDAAVAASIYAFGSVENALVRMNEIVENLGLSKTHFYEVSGYSEENITCARDFVQFCRAYVSKYPQDLVKYHSVRNFTYPKIKNLPDGWDKNRCDTEGSFIEGTKPLTQEATNKTLDKIYGADGLKTGYIDESGFNLALSVVRSGQRFLAVLMGGPGNSSVEGNQYRVEDAKKLMDLSFDTFGSVRVGQAEPVKVCLLGGSKYACNYVEAATIDNSILYPYRAGELGPPSSLNRRLKFFDNFRDNVEMGKQYGIVEYYCDDKLIFTRPLIADRDVKKGNVFRQAFARIYIAFNKKNAS
ncbi:MAG: D-alanyl-D-alanine carboxypeptidase [Treponemataceae bacterium]|nr:D-alanyl-D-alanine carboxypeptidase [Treponemataceae bacterium]